MSDPERPEALGPLGCCHTRPAPGSRRHRHRPRLGCDLAGLWGARVPAGAPINGCTQSEGRLGSRGSNAGSRNAEAELGPNRGVVMLGRRQVVSGAGTRPRPKCGGSRAQRREAPHGSTDHPRKRHGVRTGASGPRGERMHPERRCHENRADAAHKGSVIQLCGILLKMSSKSGRGGAGAAQIAERAAPYGALYLPSPFLQLDCLCACPWPLPAPL